MKKLCSDIAGFSDVKEGYFAVKVYDKLEFKSLGLLEYSVLKSIKPHPNIVKAFFHEQDVKIDENTIFK